MQKLFPKNPRTNKEDRGVNFEVEIDGRNWKAFITFEALDSLYPGPSLDRIRAVLQSSHITSLVVERIGCGDNVEPIHLSTTTLPANEIASSERRDTSPRR